MGKLKFPYIPNTPFDLSRLQISNKGVVLTKVWWDWGLRFKNFLQSPSWDFPNRGLKFETLACEKWLAFWVELVARGLSSAVYLSHVVCKQERVYAVHTQRVGAMGSLIRKRVKTDLQNMLTGLYDCIIIQNNSTTSSTCANDLSGSSRLFCDTHRSLCFKAATREAKQL